VEKWLVGGPVEVGNIAAGKRQLLSHRIAHTRI
jgi:hypothetical protein